MTNEDIKTVRLIINLEQTIWNSLRCFCTVRRFTLCLMKMKIKQVCFYFPLIFTNFAAKIKSL